MLRFIDFLLEGNPLSRVKKFEDEGRASAGITAWRGGLSDKENKNRMKSFDKDLRDLGYGYRKTEGTWEGGKEQSRYVTAKGTSKKHERSFRGDMARLSAKYDQDAVAIRRKRKTVLQGTNSDGYPGNGKTVLARRNEVDKNAKTRYNDNTSANQTEFNPSRPASERPRFTTGPGIDHLNPNRKPGHKPSLP